MRFDAWAQVGQAIATSFDRIVPAGRAAVEPLLNYPIVSAQSGRQDAGPPHMGWIPRPGRRVVPPGIGVAVAEHALHGSSFWDSFPPGKGATSLLGAPPAKRRCASSLAPAGPSIGPYRRACTGTARQPSIVAHRLAPG